MTELAILLGLAAAGYGLSRWTQFPAIPFLLAGSLGLSAIGAVGDPAFVEDVLFLSVSVLLFVAGTDLSLTRVGPFRRTAFLIGAVQFAGLAAAALGIAFGLDYSPTDALHLGLALAASSTIVGVHLLQRRQQMFEPFGRTVLGALLLQDILLVLLLPLLIRLPDGAAAVMGSLGGTIVLIVGVGVVMKGLVPVLLERELDAETQLLVVLGVLFGFMEAAAWLNVPLFAAAFLAGVSLSGFPFSGIAHSEMQPLYDFFSAIFFASLGVAAARPDPTLIGHAALFAGAVLVLTPLIVAIVGEWMGLVARSALESGLLLAQTSELSLVVGLQALVAGQIGGEVFSVIVLTTVFTMMATPLLTSETVVWELVRWHPSRRPAPLPEVPSNHVLVLGGGRSARPLLRLLRESDHETVVVDEDPTVVDRLRDRGVRCVCGDGRDRSVLLEAGGAQARVVVSLLRDPRSVGPLLDYVGDTVPILVRVFEDHEAAWVEAQGGTPVRFAQAAGDAFMDWFQQTRSTAQDEPMSPSP
ncbi:cation:proton antiporter [Salinibacter altiplanensis]|uniref:cation:proton antiporter domain-containing protein n=1 Tax=Salinibacter altiplanensis TaxID=1803181 RepID=UPI000C9FD4E3|nr:cation:proton antiporter [Salinibacter altiplanensis]